MVFSFRLVSWGLYLTKIIQCLTLNPLNLILSKMHMLLSSGYFLIVLNVLTLLKYLEFPSSVVHRKNCQFASCNWSQRLGIDLKITLLRIVGDLVLTRKNDFWGLQRCKILSMICISANQYVLPWFSRSQCWTSQNSFSLSSLTV